MAIWLEQQDGFTTAGQQECGVCIWSLADNSVVADPHLARVFDLPFEVARHGLPIERYIAKVHPEDRSKVARALHDAIISGRAYQQDYRLLHGDGTVISVLSFGQCFPDENGIASQYVGVVFSRSDMKTKPSYRNLLTVCRNAKDYALEARNGTVHSFLCLATLQLTQSALAAVV